MKTLFPAASACLVVMFVATVGYAESQIENAPSADREVTVTKDAESEEDATVEGVADVASSEEDDMASEEKDRKEDSVSELSVAPMSHVTYPEDRPSWISGQPVLDGDVHTWVVTTSGYDAVDQCEDELRVLTKAAVLLYIKETTGWVCDDDFVTDQWVEDELIGRRYIGTLEKGDLKLNEMAAELEFDAVARRRIQTAKKEVVVNDRLKASGGLFAIGLIGLCCTGGLLGIFSRRYA